MIKSLVDIDVFDQESASAFYTSLSTVGGQLANAMRSENIDDVLKKYGHLRPGTYEITNLRYDEAPELYFKKLQNNILKLLFIMVINQKNGTQKWPLIFYMKNMVIIFST